MIDILLSIIGALLMIGWVVLYNLLQGHAKELKETAAQIVLEKEKAAALVMSEKEKLAALVMQEKDKLAAIVKAEHDKLQKEFNDFRIKVAEDYATTVLLEKVLQPILAHLDKIEDLLSMKVDRREFNEREVWMNRKVTDK